MTAALAPRFINGKRVGLKMNGILKLIGIVLIIGVFWGWDSFDKVLDLFGMDATKNRQAEVLQTLDKVQNHQSPVRIVDIKKFKEELTSLTDVQEENYESKMENTIWEVSGELYDVEKKDVYAGFNTYKIDLFMMDRNRRSFLNTMVVANCFGRNKDDINLIENLSEKTYITVRGAFKSVDSEMGGYLRLKNCVVVSVGK